MKSAFLLPFIGPLPSYFPFWAKSCEINADAFHWFVYSDQTDALAHVNPAVTIIPYRVEEIVKDFKEFVGIQIDGGNLRMLCNFRLLFYFLRRDREPLHQFGFIGYTDMDMIYGRLSRYLPDNMEQYAMVSADRARPCGPFTLIRTDRVETLSANDAVRKAMTMDVHRPFDESEEFLHIVAGGDQFWSQPDPLQPAMTWSFNHRKMFSVWEKGNVTVYDNRGHKRTGGFHHFSRYKDRPTFRILGSPEQDRKWAVCKKGIFPLRSTRDWLRLWLTLII